MCKVATCHLLIESRLLKIVNIHTLSKKRFTEGLESVFGDANNESFERGGLLVAEEVQKEEKIRRPRRSTSARKNFTTDLDSLFDDTRSYCNLS